MAELDMVKNMPDISFIDYATMESLLKEMIKDFQDKYEEVTGKGITLAQADPNRLVLYACALQIYQGFQYLDRAGKQNLLKFSYGNFLDNLAALKGITRNAASAATTMIRFCLSEVRNSVITIPKGTRVTTAAASCYFETTEVVEIGKGKLYAEIKAECTVTGELGNDYEVGEINVIVDPIAYIDSVINVSVSSAGTDTENDEHLAERVFLAPSQYSVAGPDEAYAYWVKTFNSDITDVKITSPSPVVVDVRFIMKNGELPDETIVGNLQDFLEDKKIRPLTDKVQVGAPEIVEYNLDIKYYINESDKSRTETIKSDVTTAVENYIIWQCSKIGRDINPSKLTKLIIEAGAKRIEIAEPTFCHAPDNCVAKLKSKTVEYGGIEDD